MKTATSGVVLLLLGLISCADGARVKDNVTCPEKFENIHRSCFRFVNERKRWEDAQSFCETLNSDLAALEAFQEKRAVNEVIEEKYSADTTFWFGYRLRTNGRGQSRKDKVWEWIPSKQDIQTQIIPWYSSKYKIRPKTYCGGVLFTSSPPRGTKSTLLLHNGRCREQRFFVCEHKPPRKSEEKTTSQTSVPTTTSTTVVPTTTTTTTTTTSPNTLVSVNRVHRTSETQTAADTTSKVGRHMATIGDVTLVSGVTPAFGPTRTVPVSIGTSTAMARDGQVLPIKPEVLPSEVDDSGDDESEFLTTAALIIPGNGMVSNATRAPVNVITQLNTTERDEDEVDAPRGTPTTQNVMAREETLAKTKIDYRFSTDDDHIDDSSDANHTDSEVQPTSETPKTNWTTTPMNSSTTDNFDLIVPFDNSDDEDDGGVDDDDDDDDFATTASTTKTTPGTTTTRKQRPRYRVGTEPSRVDWETEFLPYRGCYIPGVRSSLRRMVLSAKEFYPDDRESCPPVRLGTLVWPATEGGDTAQIPCRNGKGSAKFTCSDDQVCWRGQPDSTECASSKLKFLLKRAKTGRGKVPKPVPGNETKTEDPTEAPPTVQESVELTSQLVQVTAEEEETTIDDVIVTSQVMTTLTDFSTEDDTDKESREQVEKIVGNVIKAGSNLVSEKKRALWQAMTSEDKVRSASTLLVAMETATTSMAERLDEPTVVEEKTEDVELELRVLDIETLEKKQQKELVYDSDNSENTFSIPIKTLKKFSKGRLAKTVFMTHYSMSDILGGRKFRAIASRQAGLTNRDAPQNSSSGDKVKDVQNPDEERDEADGGPQIASYILSASIGVEGHVTELPEPVTFTMRHIEEMDERYIPLCSFWNVSDGLSQGFWSQAGCRVVRSNSTHTRCECDHLTNFAVLMDVHGVELTAVHESILRTVTIVGCCISCVALLASFLTFLCFTSLQGERNTIHKNLSLCLLLAELLFVCGIDQAQHKIECAVIAGFLHFLFLAAFTWMFLEGVHIIFMLVQVFEAAKSRVPYYYITGYGVPTVVVGVSLIFYHEGYGTEKFCWLTTQHYFIWSFAGPVGLILLINSIFLSYALATVCRHADYVFSTREKTSGSGLKSWVQGALALEVLLGLTWLFGYFLINDSSMPIAYIFTVLNSLQGLFIFIFHCLLSKKTQKEYSQVLGGLKVKRTPGMRAANGTKGTSNSHDSNGTNSTNTQHHHQPRHVNNNSNSNSEKIELNGTAEDHQRLYVGSEGPNSSKEIQSLPV